MSKITKRVRRADSFEDHYHLLPDGSKTGGVLFKPNKDTSGMHSHLFEFGEDTMETEPMHNYGDHVHKLKGHLVNEETSGPKKASKQPGEPWENLPKMDSATVRREGREWVVRGDTGHVLSKDLSQAKALTKAAKFIKA